MSTCKNLTARAFDKGKPAESRGRKATGLTLGSSDSHDRQAAEDEKRLILSTGLD